MKRIFFLYLAWVVLLTAPIFGRAYDPWGISQDSIDVNIFGVDKLLNRETLYYAVSDDITPEEEKIFTDALRKWPKDTLKAIQEVKREEDFADIVPILQQDIQLKKTDMKHGEVTLELDPTGDICGQDAGGCHFTSTHRIVVRKDYRHLLKEVITHEIGHFYGLGDQYERCRHDSSPIYSSNPNYIEGSVMSNTYETKGELTCDDNDGFINLIDLRLSQFNGLFPERSQNGWWSLCKETKNLYQNAQTINRESDTVTLKDGQTQRTTSYNEQGQPTESLYATSLDENLWPLFTMARADTIAKNNAGLITRITSAKGTSLCPVVKGKSVRNFSYSKNWDGTYEIRIHCVGNNKTYSFPVIEKPGWYVFVILPPSGKADRFRQEFPMENNYSVAALFKEGTVRLSAGGSGFVTVNGEDNIHSARLQRPLQETKYQAEVEGYQEIKYELTEQDFRQNLANQNLLDSHRAILLEAKDAFKQVAPYVPGFYEKFYKPLVKFFNAQKAQR